MKNREKYREEILKCAVVQRRDLCDFKRKVVFPHFGKEDGCSGISCAWCRMLTDLWFDEEYVEPQKVEPQKPEVDWDKVPVDTLVRVRDYEDQDWTLAYFVRMDSEHNFVTWADGRTSKTAFYDEHTFTWKYCELVEEEDDGSN